MRRSLLLGAILGCIVLSALTAPACAADRRRLADVVTGGDGGNGPWEAVLCCAVLCCVGMHATTAGLGMCGAALAAHSI
jgi:hypothetical protein